MAAPACWLLALLLPLGTAQEASSTEPYSSTPILPSSPSAVSEEWVNTEIPGAPIAVMMMTTTTTATIHSTGVALSFTGSTSVVPAPQTTVASSQRTEIPDSRYERPSRVQTQILTTEESDMAFPATTGNSDILVSGSSPEGHVEILRPTSTQAWNEPDLVTLHSMPPWQSAATTSSPEATVGGAPDISIQGRLTASDAHWSSTAEKWSVLRRSTAASVLAVRSSETLSSTAIISSMAEDQTQASEVSTLDEGCASTCHPKIVLATSATPLMSSAHLITRAQPTVSVTSMPAHISATRMTDSAIPVSESLSTISVAAAAAAVAPTSSWSPPFSRPQTLLVHLSSSLHQSSEVSASFFSTPVIEFLSSVSPSALHSDLFVQTSSRRAFDVRPSSQESPRVTLQPTLLPLTEDSSTRAYSQTRAASSDVAYSASTASEALRPATRAAERTAAPATAATNVLEPSGSIFMLSSTPVRGESTVSTAVTPASQSVMSPAASEAPSSAFGMSPNVTPSTTAFAASTTTTTSITTTTTTLASPTAANRSVTAAASSTASTAAGTNVTPTVAANTSRTVVARNVTLTTTHPRHPATRTVIRDARYLFKLSGDCHLIVNNTEYFERFLAGFHDLLTKHLHIREEAYKLGDITCGSVHVYVTFLHVPMPHFDGVLQAAVRTGGEELVVPVWMESHFVTFQLVHVQEVAFKSTVETYNIVNEVMDEVDVIVIVVACCVCAVLVAIGVAICVKECYRRKHAQSFDLLEVPHVNLKLEDFTLTRIPRPRPVYTESAGVKVKVKAEASCLNGSSEAHYVSAGSCKPACVINPENIHVRMASNSEGLVVGITCHPSAVTGCQVDPHLSGTSRKSKSKNRNASGDKHCDEDDEDHQASEKLLGSLCHGGADGTANPVFVDEPEEGARDSDCGEESD